MSFSEPVPPRETARARHSPGFLLPILLLIAGLALIGLVAGLEAHHFADAPWTGAIFVPHGRLSAPGVIPVVSRRVPLATVKAQSLFLREMLAEPGGEDLADTLDLLDTEYVIAADSDAATLKPLLEEGRTPVPGTPEVVAGALARFDQFTLDGVRFQVVGRLRGSVASLAFTYLLPKDPAFAGIFSPGAGALEGSLVPDGMARLDTLFPPDEQEDGADPLPRPVSPRALTRPAFGLGLGVWLGLMLVALGGAWAFRRLLTRLQPGAPRWLKPLLDDVRTWPRLYRAAHLALYGLFFGTTLYGLCHPLLNYHITQFLEHAFSEGSLGYIGRAYGSGSIPRAAAATFVNNYFLQTLLLTFVASIPPVAFGFIKTGFSFALAGLAMAPIWMGTAAHLTYHAITMILEFEAYILASFIALLWPLRLIRGVRRQCLHAEVLHGLKTFGSGALVTAILLAIAATYEAATLILFRMGGM